MQSLSSFYAMGSCPDNPFDFVHGVLNSTDMFNVENSAVSSLSYAEAKAAASNKSHSEAERRRRRRINGHLATLRTLVPSTIKTDKASLLAEVVRCLKELKGKTEALAEMADNVDDDCSYHGSDATMKHMLPTETDQLKLCYCDENQGTVQATLCCEDRPQMMVELTRALNSVQAKVVKAEMATIGGRTKSVLWVQVAVAGEEGLVTLRRALKVVMDKSTLLPAGLGQGLLGNKRPRLYHC